ncbi:hypothetical protein [Tunturiibacter gelidoferens]|uniref:Uncharacterized protein n=1 Tax=Tunturiibacter lichenicola TaxID=2051959 RepID=A0A7Y9NKK4_9BACT|nr:hypothetical protein [Edaphobacter lichenicola]NYF51079.1 hypothetical protein [Edaphobacter lichenicola]
MPSSIPSVPTPPSSALLWIGFAVRLPCLRSYCLRALPRPLHLHPVGPLDQAAHLRLGHWLTLRGPEVEIEKQRPQGQNLGQSDLAGVHARLRRRGQQRLPNPLGQAQPGTRRTLFQQRELRLADFGAYGFCTERRLQ